MRWLPGGLGVGTDRCNCGELGALAELGICDPSSHTLGESDPPSGSAESSSEEHRLLEPEKVLLARLRSWVRRSQPHLGARRKRKHLPS